MSKYILLGILVLLLNACLNNGEQNKSNDGKFFDSEFHGFLKNLYELNGELIAEVDLVEIDKNNNINNQDVEIKKFTIVQSWGLERPKVKLFNEKKEFKESKDIYVFKTNSIGEISGIAKHE